MNQLVKQYSGRIAATLMLVMTQMVAMAQDAVEINQQEVQSWLQRNWLWVAGGVLLLLLIIVMSRKSSSTRQKSTTVVKDEYGNVKSVTTTEVRE